MKKRSFIGTRDRKVPRPNEVRQPEAVRKLSEPSEDYTLEQALTLFIRAKEVENVRDRTIKEYINHVNYLTDFMTQVKGFSDAFLADLDADLIREYIRYMLTEKRRYADVNGRKDKTVGLSPNTVNIRLRTLKTMCRFWHKEGLAPINAMENIKQLRTDEVEEVPGISDGMMDVVLDSFDETQFADWRDKILCLMMLDTGLRPGESCGLTIDRVDFHMLVIFVPSQVAKNRRNREVPMSREVAKLLRELYEESLRYFGETEHIFNNAYGDPYTAAAFGKRLNRLKNRLGIERLSPNMFRHTFCRNYLLNGGDIFTLQKIVDHADIKTTRKYVQMETEHVKSQHNKFSPVRRIFNRR